jgi:O-antigen biosynthesis protein
MLNFLTKLFMRQNAAMNEQDVSAAEVLPLKNSIEWFDAQWYVQRYPDVAIADMDPAYHYFHFGITEGRFPNGYRESLSAAYFYKPSAEQLLALLKACSWFDAAWYLQHYPDVAAAGADAAYHYLHFGAAEGRLPGPQFDKGLKNDLTKQVVVKEPEPETLLDLLSRSEWFDQQWYFKRYPDIAETGMAAAFHFLHHGAAEGRLPGPRFDNAYYLSQLADEAIDIAPLLHFLTVGEAKGFLPCRSWTTDPWWWQLPKPTAMDVNCAALLQRLQQQSPAIVIVPVFNAAEALSRCLYALCAHHQGIAKIILINDASTDPAIESLISQYQAIALFHCAYNNVNLGFSGSVNLGMALAAKIDATADVVLLNSDTEVCSGWLRQLRYAAYSADNIATVTPVSNNAGVFSVPVAQSNVPEQFGLERYARALAQCGNGNFLSVPTGHGFCLYIRRAALNEAGDFDAAAFPRGYGEENDFCMRLLQLGWRHLVAPKAYVFHLRSASFGEEKNSLLEQGRKVIDRRYPMYAALVREAFSSSEFEALRQHAAAVASIPQQLASQVRPRALYVLSTRTGGTPKTNQDLMQALAQKLECFVLHSDSKMLTLQHFADGVYTELATYNLAKPITALPHVSQEYDTVVTGWLLQWSIELVHVRHLAWHSLGLLQVVKTLGLALVHSFHDFYTLCPTVKLLDNNLQYCAAVCTKGTGYCKPELWPEHEFVALKHQQIKQWQQQFERYLPLCDAFVTTNAQARALIQQRYPVLANKPFNVIEHGRDFTAYASLAVAPRSGEKIRLLCPGNISIAKGLAVIQQLALHFSDIVEVHILGNVSSELVLPENVIIHGGYAREQFLQRVATIKPHVGAVLSIWPETWCHTLTELWAAGIPVVGFSFGAVAERINACGGGWLAPTPSAAAVVTILMSMVDSKQWQIKQQAVMQWQRQPKKNQSCDAMAQQYYELYGSLLVLDR